jgi:hypothetical protein
MQTIFLSGNLNRRDHFEDTGVYGRKILQWDLQKWDGGSGLDSSGSG